MLVTHQSWLNDSIIIVIIITCTEKVNDANVKSATLPLTFLPWITSAKPGPWKWNGTPVPGPENNQVSYIKPIKISD